MPDEFPMIDLENRAFIEAVPNGPPVSHETRMIGYRFEYTDGKELRNFPGGLTYAHAEECTIVLNPLLNWGPTHPAPHWACQCGFRVVADHATLQPFLENYWDMAELCGANFEKDPKYTKGVIVEVEAGDPVTRSQGLPYDPELSIRASRMRLRRIWAPDHIDRDQMADFYDNQVPVAPLPRGRYPTLHRGPFPEQTLSSRTDKTHIHLTLGYGGEISLPWDLVNTPEAVENIMTYAENAQEKHVEARWIALNLVRPFAHRELNSAEEVGAVWGTAALLGRRYQEHDIGLEDGILTSS